MCATENEKAIQPGTVLTDEDPVELRAEKPGEQELLDDAWANAVWTGEGPPQVESGA